MAVSAPRRQEQARRTRRTILDAATRLFAERGYAATTMTAVTDRAGVALDTVDAAIGPKPVLFRLLVETAISGTDAPVPALERDYVRAIRAEPDPARKLTLYAQAIGRIQQRLAPLVQVLQQAAAGDAELAALWRGIADRRAANMRLFAAELAATGALRPELSVEEVADVLWSTNSPELYLLLVDQRGWDPDRYQRWLADAWQRLLLRPA
ncbi:MAG: putative transcriptional regulator, TetR family [Actinomycetia bacterium]|jgi:AcrR family transcriptional regulator|nr:putative transcriptional regulator, TetR family [Actinomycetes bacterium]